MLYEILTGAPPFADLGPAERLYHQLHESLPALSLRRPDLPEAVHVVIQKATAKQPADRYPDVLSLVADLQQVVVLADGRARAVGYELAPPSGIAPALPQAPSLAQRDALTVPLVVESPYKGLRAFQEADAADFFGRTALTERLLGRLGEEGDLTRFLAVVGPSGSGKSSVVRAGLVPALRRGVLPGSDRWFVVELFPGAHPLEELEAALLRIAVNPPPSLLAQLQEDARGLARAVKRVLPGDATTELVLLIDQFEEAFSLVADEATRAHFLDRLHALVTDPRSRARVIVTLRTDFYDRPLLYHGVSELLRERTEAVVPLTLDEVTQAIVGPATRVGLTVESDLIAAIVHDVGEQPGMLPLLQYAMTELFERREGLRLTLVAYRASGGVLGALARRADELYRGLNAIQQVTARQLFLRLVTLGEGSAGRQVHPHRRL